MPEEIEQGEYSLPVPPRSDGIIGVYTPSDVIQRIRYTLRRYTEEIGKDGKIEWIPPKPIIEDYQISKEEISKMEGGMEGFLAELQGQNAKIIEEMESIFTIGVVVREIRPLVNEIGEHDIIALFTSFLNRNIYLSSFPGKQENDMFVYKMVSKFAHDFINMIGINAQKYDIQEPTHIKTLTWIMVVNVFAALQMAVGAGGRMTLEKILGETKVIQERPIQEGPE